MNMDDLITLAMHCIGKKETNFYAADVNMKLTIMGCDIDVESIWYADKDDKIYLHVGCKDFEGDIDIESLSEENTRRLAEGLRRMAGIGEEKVTSAVVFGSEATRAYDESFRKMAKEVKEGNGCIVKREFGTQNERKAYLQGLEDMAGWEDSMPITWEDIQKHAKEIDKLI